jgi:hypothetical protein
MPIAGANFRIPMWFTHSVWHEAHESVCKHLQQWRISEQNAGSKRQRLLELQLRKVEPDDSRAQRLTIFSL